MKYSRRYKKLNTDLNKLYDDILMELQSDKDLNIVSELKGEEEGRNIKSLTAVRQSIPRAMVGGLRDVTVTLSGDPNDFIIEAHTGSWFSNLAIPGAGGFLIAGPIGSAAAAGASGIYAAEYQRKLQKRIRELVKEHSKNKLSMENVEHFP